MTEPDQTSWTHRPRRIGGGQGVVAAQPTISPVSRPPRGRPLSSELADRLMAVTIDILAEDGWDRLNPDRIAARARAGKAGIYRRWPSKSALVRQALNQCTLVAAPPDSSTLCGDLSALLELWQRPLDQAERAAASLLGAALHDEELRAALEESLVQPLSDVVHELSDREAQRGRLLPPPRVKVLAAVVQALWWQRYTEPGATPLSTERVQEIIDQVLLPIGKTQIVGRSN